MRKTAALATLAAMLAACGAEEPAAVASRQEQGLVASTWIYRDALVSPWYDWTWASANLSATGRVDTGTRSIAVSFQAWQALYFRHPGLATSGLKDLVLRVNGGKSGTGAALRVRALLSNGTLTSGTDLGPRCEGGKVVAGKWVTCTVPVTAFAPSGSTITGVQIEEWRGGSIAKIFFDEIGFTSSTTPAPQPQPVVAVSISPTSAALTTGGTRQFTASVSGTTNTAVTWSVLESGGGSVSSSGLYTAPSTAGTYRVVARSVADATKSATATVTVSTPAPQPQPVVAVNVSPTSTSLTTGGTRQFTASVSGTTNTAVTWSVQESGGGSVSSSGLYTAPSSAGTYHVVARSVADATKSATATVTVSAPAPQPPPSGDPLAILPEDRRTTWNPGIPGGIPTNRRVYTTLSSLPSNGTGDVTSAINQAISGAGAAYASSGVIQEVVLPAGTFRAAGTITLNVSGVVLRGQGMKTTRIRHDGGGTAIRIGRSQWTDYTSSFGPWNLVQDGLQGTNEVVVSGTSGASIQVGDVLCIDQEDDLSYVRMGDARYEKRQPSADNNGPALRTSGAWRSVTSLVRVTSKYTSGSNVVLVLADPLHLDFRTSQRAQVFQVASPRSPIHGVHWAGVENLYFTGGTLKTNNVAFSWVKNVEADGNPGTSNVGSYSTQGGISGRSIDLFHAYRFEVRGSYIHHSRNIGQGGSAYLLSISSYTSESLIEDNIVVYGNKLIVGNMMGGGNVIAYNYVDNARTSHSTWQEGAIDLNHQSFTHNALVEGNWSTNIGFDSTHGNAGWHVFFRNHATGRNSDPIYGAYPYTRNPDGSFMRAVGVDGYSRESTFIGNVLKTDGNGVYEINQSTSNSGPPAIYRIGWAFGGDGSARDDGTALRLMYRHGNFDSVTGTVKWDAARSKTLPSSLYLASKPAFFGASAWPWVDPAGASAADRVKVLPAKARFDAM